MDTRELTLGRVLARQAARFGDRRLLSWLPDGRTYGFAQADDISTRVANGLLARGVTKGTHVALLMENSPEFLLLAFALGKLGAVVVPINTAARGQLLQYYLDQSDSTVLVADEALLERVADRSRLSCVITTPEFAALETSPATPMRWDVRHDDLACILYTSGTTGPSKGNMQSQSAALSIGLSNVEHHHWGEGDVIYACLPLFHMNALQAAAFAALLAGIPIALAPRFSASGYWRDIRDSGATVTNMLGSMASILWNQPASENDRNTLRMANCAPIPPFARAFEERFGLRLASSFGISDYALITVYTADDPRDKLGSAGRPRSGMHVRIVDESGREQPPGQAGEILVRCDDPGRVASGYYRMPEQTAQARPDGWFHTGDLGFFDTDGYLQFAGRRKDAIRRSGENVSAFEVEQILDGHCAIAESAVFAVAAEQGGEDEVAACIVRKAGAALAEADVIAFCSANMAYYMVPRYLRFVDELPRTLNHKVEKYRLRELLEANRADAWDRVRAGITVRRG